ncbi:hypothetical protein glysoja_010903, partial [Glycine soja]
LDAKNGWRNLWLECDSIMIVEAFRNDGLVPWQLKNRWLKCTALVTRMNFVVGHIFREDNACADMLVPSPLLL